MRPQRGLSRGSSPPAGVPILWQIRSDAPPAGQTQLRTFVVGETPVGFYETVTLAAELPSDLIGINGPPDDSSSHDGMTFTLADLPRDAVLRGDYQVVAQERFDAEALATCGCPGPRRLLGSLGVVAIGAGLGLTAGRRRPTMVLVGILVIVIGLSGTVREVVVPAWTLPIAGSGAQRQAAAAFALRQADEPVGRTVLRELTHSASRPELGGAVVARVVAPDAYGFVVECDGLSIQIGELSELRNGSTGGRQLIGCATPGVVRGLLADRTDRSDLVELVIVPDGSTHWRIQVVEGEGDVGPFIEH